MKFTIEGLSQKFLASNRLDCTDAVLLRYIIDFYNTDKMAKVSVDGVEYFWLKYEYVIEQLPIIGIKSKDGLYRRMKKYVDCGVMKHYTKRSGGTYSCYRFDKQVLTQLLGNQSDSTDEKSEGYGSEVGGGTDEKSEQKTLLSEKTLLSKDSSAKDKPPAEEGKESSNQSPNATEQEKIPAARFVEAFNATGLPKIIKLTPERKKHLNARIKEWSEDEVLRVIKLAGQSTFLSGKNDRGRKAIFAWPMGLNNFATVVAAGYGEVK